MSKNDNNFIPTFTYVEDLAKQNQIKREKKDSIIQNEINKKEKERELNEKKKEINVKEKEIEKDNEFIPIGLTKLNDCIYINPILQLLGGISDFRIFFIKNKKIYKDKLRESQIFKLSFVTSRLYANLYEEEETKKSKLYKSHNFLRVSKNLNSFIGNNKDTKIKDIFIFVLNQLHDENNKKNENKIKQKYNRTNLKESINNGIEANNEENNSIITAILNYLLLQTIKCPECNNKLFEIKSFSTYELNICSAYQKIMTPNEKRDLFLKDCLNNEKINEEKPFKFYCNICKAYKITKEIYFQFYEIKDKIIFLLDRDSIFDENKLSLIIPFKLEETINMGEYMFIDNNTSKYELTGIISGEIKEKRYVCFSKSCVNNKWYLYIDEYTEKKNIKDILDEHNDKLKYIPYILMYSKIK